DAQALRVELLPEPQRAEPAVLVVDARDTARARELHAGAHRDEVLLVGDRQVALLEPPGSFLAQDARRLTVRVALDDSPAHLEIAVRSCERRRVEPQRVVVLREQRRRLRTGHLVEVARGRLAGGRPIAAARAVAAHPPALGARRVAHARARLLERRATVDPHVALGARP